MTIWHGLQYITLAVTYCGLALGFLPGLRMNRATIALMGSAALIALGVLDLESAWQAIDATTIVFLLSMMVINAHLAYAGFFQLTLMGLLYLTSSPLGILVVLTMGTGLLSAVFLNDTLALVTTPLTVVLTEALGLNPVPYLLAIAAATNIGSVATLSGNPQNILIGSFSGIGYLEFLQVMAPIALMGLVLQLGVLYWLYPDVRSLHPCQPINLQPLRLFKPLLSKTLVITVGLLAALVAASLLLITRRLKPERILKQVDWTLLLMFSGLFVVTKGTEQLNVLAPLVHLVDSRLGLLGVTTLLSNVVSNVPAVLLLQSTIAPDDTQAWLLLAAASTLAGNLTLFGAVANLIVVEAVSRLGYTLTFWDHLRFGIPITVLTLALTYLWI
jgi:Na+/H+ antiporter NhaD/arsenite permease-like protein